MRYCLSLVATTALASASLVSAEHVHLVAGDVLIAEVVEHGNGVVVIEHELLGRVELPADAVVAIITDDAGEVHAAIDPLTAPDAGPRIEPSLGAMTQDPPPAPEKEWKTSVDFGVNASYGNTDDQSFQGGFVTSRKSEESATSITGRFFFSKTDGDTSENRITAGILQDWFVPDTPWLYFAKARYDYDDFQSWLHRASAHGGVGYQFIERENYTLTGRAGLGAIREWRSANEDVRLEGLLGLDVVWQISDKQNLKAGTTYYPDFDDTGEFRWENYLDWDLLVDEETNMSLTFGLLHEHQSKVAAGRKNDDFRVYGGLQFDF